MIGPQVFSRLINTGSYEQVFLALSLGAVMMILGGLAELVFGVKAERRASRASPSRSPSRMLPPAGVVVIPRVRRLWLDLIGRAAAVA